MNKTEQAIYDRITKRLSKNIAKYIKELINPEPVIEDFTVEKNKDGLEYVAWDQIEEILGAKEYKKFNEWMMGQTCVEEGAYPWDLSVYLDRVRKGLSYIWD